MTKRTAGIWSSRTHAGRRVPWAWVMILAAQSQLTRLMDAHLRADHGLTIRDYEVLLRLSWSPQGKLSRRELADSVHLTQGGITRLLEGLQRSELVTSAVAERDRRIVYACLTDDGRARLREAARTHTADVRSMFTSRYTDAELATLADLLSRLTIDHTDRT